MLKLIYKWLCNKAYWQGYNDGIQAVKDRLRVRILKTSLTHADRERARYWQKKKRRKKHEKP